MAKIKFRDVRLSEDNKGRLYRPALMMKNMETILEEEKADIKKLELLKSKTVIFYARGRIQKAKTSLHHHQHGFII